MTNLWERALGDLRAKLSAENFETWLGPVEFVTTEGDTIVLRIPNSFFAEWLSNNYLDVILESLHGIDDGKDLRKVQWEVDEELQARVHAARQSQPPPPPPTPPPLAEPDRPDLSPKYRFENFVVGPSNQLAHAASVAVGSSPGKRYNPL